MARVCGGEKESERDKARVFFIGWFVIWATRVFGGKRGSERDIRLEIFMGYFVIWVARVFSPSSQNSTIYSP